MGELWRRLARLFRAGRFESDLEEEMRFHLEMKVQETGDRHRAQRQFGRVGFWKEVSREMWGWNSVERLFQDLRYALRQLARNPGLAAVAILSLALGTGANTAIFSMIDHILLRLLPVSQPEQLIAVRESFSYPQYERLRERNRVLSDTIGVHFMPRLQAAIEGRPPAEVAGELVSGNYFPALGVRARLGRTITPDDDRGPESGPVAVISYAYWQRIFGGSEDALGAKIQVRTGELNGNTSGLDVYAAGRQGSADGAILTIIGVAAPGFFGDAAGRATDVWIPITMQPAVMPGRPFLTQDNAVWVNVMGRRNSGVSLDRARASLAVTWRQILLDAEGGRLTDARQREIAGDTLTIESGEKGFGPIRRGFEQPLLILMSVVGLVLLNACLNVANLLLARATTRRREIAVRLSLGAGRLRLVRQLLTESLVLAFAGGAAGVALAFAGEKLLIAMLGSLGQTVAISFEIDFRTLGFTAALSMLTGLLFGLAPALRGTRVELAGTMKEGSRGTSGAGGGVAVKILVAAQVAVSTILLIGAGLFLRTLYNLKTEDVGYNPDRLVLMRVDPVSAGFRGDSVGRAMEALLHRIRALPGVRAATLSENGLFSDTESGTYVNIDGFKAASNADREARFDQIGPGYFTTVGIPILHGRDMSERDAPGAPAVAIVNQTMAKFYFPGANPIGKHIRSGEKVDLEIVGVVRDAQDHSFRWKPVRRFYVSYLHPIDGITTANFEIRTNGNPGNLGGMLRQQAQAVSPNLPVLGIKEINVLMDESVAPERLIARLSTFFGALGLVLAAIGLYGVMSYAVARRTSEIGIRMALGAPAPRVVAAILRESTTVIAGGAMAGVAAAFVLTRLIRSFLFGLTPADPISFAAAVALLLLVGLLAAYLPARRAARIDPLIALRYE